VECGKRRNQHFNEKKLRQITPAATFCAKQLSRIILQTLQRRGRKKKLLSRVAHNNRCATRNSLKPKYLIAREGC